MEIYLYLLYLYYFLAIEGAYIALPTHPKVTDDFKKSQA